VDLDFHSHLSALFDWVYLDPDQHSKSRSGSGFRRAKLAHIIRNYKEFHVLKCWMFSFEG
jgi:hypothetical protein